MNFLKSILFIVSICILWGCNRVVVDYEENALLFSGVDQEQVDSIFYKLTLEQQLGMLLIWKPQCNNRNLSLLQQYLRQGKVSGHLLDNIELKDYIALDSLVSTYPILPPINFSNQPHFFQNQFADLPKQPSGMTIASLSSDQNKPAFFAHKLAPDSIRHNATWQRSFLAAPKSPEDFDTHFSPVSREHLVQRANQSLLTDQKAGLLAFNGPLDGSCFPLDTLPLAGEKINCLYSLIKNGLSGLEVSSEVWSAGNSGVVTPNIVRNYLDREYEFRGLLLGHCKDTIAVEQAYLAGVDLLVIDQSVPQVVNKLIALMEESRVAAGMLEGKVKKIIKARLYLENQLGQEKEEAKNSLVDQESLPMEQVEKIEEAAITVIHNPNDLLPLKDLRLRRFKILDIGEIPSRPFRKQMEHYTDVGLNFVKNKIPIELPNESLFADRPVIVYLNDVNLSDRRNGDLTNRINLILKNKPAVVVNIGHPYNLSYLDTTAAFVQAYANHSGVQKALAEVVFGARSATGILPFALAEHLPKVASEKIPPTRLRYGTPEEVGVAGYKLVEIDALVGRMLRKGASPGCQVLVAKSGVVIYNKAFGHLDSAKIEEVEVDNLYDVASVTKVAATTLAAMRLYEDKKLAIKNRIGSYLHWASESKLQNVTVRDLMTHRSGIQPHMPIVPIVFPKEKRADCNPYTCNYQKGNYQIQVTDNMFLSVKARDTIWQKIAELTARRRRYRYSDVNFMLLQKIIEKQSRESLDQYVFKNFYRPLNLRRTTFKPLEKFKASEIAPSAFDGKWRKKLLRGYVHDEAAALQSGVGGNAGLFSTAEELAIIGQMLLNKGSYGGTQFFKPETVAYFTKAAHGNHRGLGFDKLNRRKRKGVVSRKVSGLSFGHTGFTGCLFWIDPKEDLIVIFNANRIHPKVNNRELFRGQYRKKIQDVVYRAISEGKKKGLAKAVGF